MFISLVDIIIHFKLKSMGHVRRHLEPILFSLHYDAQLLCLCSGLGFHFYLHRGYGIRVKDFK